MNKPLILVVEDDRPVRNLIVTTLKSHDYRYLTAENGHGAIMEATSHNPDIVLLDLGLPDIDLSLIHIWSFAYSNKLSASSSVHFLNSSRSVSNISYSFPLPAS